jgi:phage terminase large subunit
MIHFQITQSPDLNVVTTFKYFLNQLYLGRSGDLAIQDPELKRLHVMIEVIGQDLLIHPQGQVESFQINGKRATAIRKLKIGDNIGIGSSVIKILDFAESQSPTKKQILNNKLQRLMQQQSPRLGVIEALTQMMK